MAGWALEMINADKTQSLESTIAAVRAGFLSKMEERLAEFDAWLGQVEDRNDMVSALDQIGRSAHKIAGVAETLGFSKLGLLAAQIDTNIRSALSGSLTSDGTGNLVREVDVMLDHMSALIPLRQNS